MKLYNTLTREKENFEPLDGKKVKMYLCGPTVYDSAHLGHGRSAVAFDVIRRYLIYKGYSVEFVSNYTDIDDKMINRAKDKKIEVSELAEKIIPIYIKDYSNLNIKKPDKSPRATDYIEDIIKIIKKIEEKGAAYELDDGIYYDISKFPEYGKLSHQKLEDLKMGARVEVKKGKKQQQDFALWKFEKPGEPTWNSPWGKGRPGWHIECSAMTMSILGETLDIHAGGADLTFPHHECEIAQSEVATGKPFVKYWLHNGFVNINEEKMSKSLGNFLVLGDLIEKYGGSVIRYFYVQTHYRSPINFTYEALENAKNGLQRIHDFVRSIKIIKNEGKLNDEVKTIISTSREKFESSMDDDFETPEALAALFELIKSINVLNEETPLTKSDSDEILNFLTSIDEVFGFIIQKDETIDNEIKDLITQREIARNERNWEKSDELRDILESKGIIIEDTPDGTRWKKS